MRGILHKIDNHNYVGRMAFLISLHRSLLNTPDKGLNLDRVILQDKPLDGASREAHDFHALGVFSDDHIQGPFDAKHKITTIMETAKTTSLQAAACGLWTAGHPRNYQVLHVIGKEINQ